jgi:hypothetical protein
MICQLCNRELILGPSVDEHHLIPKTFKGTETVLLHKICHRKIHATFTERELANYYKTIDLLLSHYEIEKFVKWVSKKDPEYYDISKETNHRKNKKLR